MLSTRKGCGEPIRGVATYQGRVCEGCGRANAWEFLFGVSGIENRGHPATGAVCRKDMGELTRAHQTVFTWLTHQVRGWSGAWCPTSLRRAIRFLAPVRNRRGRRLHRLLAINGSVRVP